MAILTNTFEGGTDGALVTTANSGGVSGDALNGVTAGIYYSSTYSAHGGLSAKIVDASTNYRSFNWATTESNVFVRQYFYFAGSVLPGTLFSFQVSSGTGTHLSVLSTTLGRIQLYSAGANRGTTTDVILPDTWYRAEIKASATTIRWALYEGDSITPIYESAETTGVTMGTISQVIFGKNNANDESGTARYIDSIGLKTGDDATVWEPWPYEEPSTEDDPEDLVWTGAEWR